MGGGSNQNNHEANQQHVQLSGFKSQYHSLTAQR